MDVIDLDEFEQRAAWLEHCDGMSRFAAESEAARRQGVQRWEVVAYAKNRARDTTGGGDNRQTATRDAADDLSRVQPAPKKEV